MKNLAPKFLLPIFLYTSISSAHSLPPNENPTVPHLVPRNDTPIAERPHCFGLGTNKYGRRHRYVEMVDSFCMNVTHSPDLLSFNETMIPDERTQTVLFSVSGPAALNVSKEVCTERFKAIAYTCDNFPDNTNNMDWTAGGKLIGPGYNYTIAPLNERLPWIKQPYWLCLYDQQHHLLVKGRGWDPSTLGIQFQTEFSLPSNGSRDYLFSYPWEFDFKIDDLVYNENGNSGNVSKVEMIVQGLIDYKKPPINCTDTGYEIVYPYVG